MNKLFSGVLASSATRAALIAACVMSIGAATGAKANTITQALTIAAIIPPNSNSYATNSFAEFDTALGTLNNIQVSLGGFVVFGAGGSTPLRLDLMFGGSNQAVVPGITMFTPGVANLTFAGTNSLASNFAFVEGTGTTKLDLVLSGLGLSTFTVLGGFSGNITYDYSAAPSATPVPAALSLFATGLGALGLLGWRRKRKAPLAV